MPTVFLSSTIRDLGDLRSAMKFWLEEQGFVVYASETPEFPYPLDRQAIAASLVPIELSDYYVLLVGSRRGQLIKDEGISVTRAEFRHAREMRRKTGKPHMLHLVRRTISEARHTGRPREVSEEDWPAIVDFLNEVANEGRPGDPTWLSEFENFRSIVEILRATLRISGPLMRRALEANLLWEIKSNTRQLLGRGTGTNDLRPHALLFPDDLRFPGRIDERVRIEAPEAYWMFVFRLTLRSELGRSALAEAIDSGAFLDYDVTTSSYVVGPLQRALLELRQHMQALDSCVESVNTNETIAADTTELADAAREKRTAHVVEFTVRMLYGAWSATMNVLRLGRALYRALSGIDRSIQPPEILPAYAPDEETRMAAEQVTEQDAEFWLRSGLWRLPRAEGSPGAEHHPSDAH